MASSSKTTGKKGSLFIPKNLHFMRVILNQTMKSQKMEIPRKFLSVHGKGLSESAVLKLPSGETWKVELLKNGNHEVSFGKGWEKFIAFYSVDYGDFLIFEYEGDSLFNVFIVDKSFTEVDQYPCHRTKEATAGSNQEDQNIVELIGKLGIESEKRGKETKGKEKLVSASRNSPGDLGGSPAEKNCYPSRLLEKSTPLAAVVKPHNPRFTVQIKVTHLPPRSTLNIPAWFARKYFVRTEASVTLKDFKGGSWQLSYATCGTEKGARLRFQGWGDFARDNCLVIDNICSFDMLNEVGDPNITFQVTIFRPKR